MKTIKGALIAAMLLISTPALAESNEVTLGLEGGLVMPGFSSQDSTAFALATWNVGGVVQYGLLEDLFLQGRIGLEIFSGSTSTTKEYAGRELLGDLRFSSTHIQVSLGARYKVYAGYNFAPYVELLSGVMWSMYRDQDFLTEDGKSYGLDLPNFGEGAPFVGIGVVADYRLANLFFVGAAIRYTEYFGATYSRAISLPVQFSYYW